MAEPTLTGPEQARGALTNKASETAAIRVDNITVAQVATGYEFTITVQVQDIGLDADNALNPATEHAAGRRESIGSGNHYHIWISEKTGTWNTETDFAGASNDLTRVMNVPGPGLYLIQAACQYADHTPMVPSAARALPIADAAMVLIDVSGNVQVFV